MYFRFMNDVMFVYIVARYRRRDSDLTGSSMAYGVAPWRILKLTHQGVAPNWGQSLMSAIALLVEQITD